MHRLTDLSDCFLDLQNFKMDCFSFKDELLQNFKISTNHKFQKSRIHRYRLFSKIGRFKKGYLKLKYFVQHLSRANDEMKITLKIEKSCGIYIKKSEIRND